MPSEHPGGKPLYRGFRGIARLGVQRAHSAFDQARIGDDVVGGAALDCANGHHRRQGRPHLARYDGLQLSDQMAAATIGSTVV